MGAVALGTLNVTVIGDIYEGRERERSRVQLQRPLRRDGELPRDRRPARDLGVVLPVRPSFSRDTDRYRGPVFVAQPRAAQLAEGKAVCAALAGR